MRSFAIAATLSMTATSRLGLLLLPKHWRNTPFLCRSSWDEELFEITLRAPLVAAYRSSPRETSFPVEVRRSLSQRYSPKVLVCEADEIVRALISHVLRREGFEVEVADHASLVQRLRESQFDAVVLDSVPDGDAAVDHKRTVLALLPALAERAPSSMYATLRKPIEFGLLVETVRDCVRQGG